MREKKCQAKQRFPRGAGANASSALPRLIPVGIMPFSMEGRAPAGCWTRPAPSCWGKIIAVAKVRALVKQNRSPVQCPGQNEGGEIWELGGKRSRVRPGLERAGEGMEGRGGWARQGDRGRNFSSPESPQEPHCREKQWNNCQGREWEQLELGVPQCRGTRSCCCCHPGVSPVSPGPASELPGPSRATVPAVPPALAALELQPRLRSHPGECIGGPRLRDIPAVPKSCPGSGEAAGARSPPQRAGILYGSSPGPPHTEHRALAPSRVWGLPDPFFCPVSPREVPEAWGSPGAAPGTGGAVSAGGSGSRRVGGCSRGRSRAAARDPGLCRSGSRRIPSSAPAAPCAG